MHLKAKDPTTNFWLDSIIDSSYIPAKNTSDSGANGMKLPDSIFDDGSFCV